MISATLLSQLPQDVQRLVQRVSNRSVAGFEQLCDRFVDCSEPQLCILQPLFYMHLDPDCIPEKSTPAATTDIELACWSLLAIFSTLGYIDGSSFGSGSEKQYILSAWNRVAPWLVFFHDQFIMRRANYRPVNRASVIKLVTSILFHVGAVQGDCGPSGNTALDTTPTLYRPIAELWLLAIETKDVDAVCISHQSFAHIVSFRVCSSFLVAQCKHESFVTTLLEVSGGIGPFTSAVLKYVKSIRSMAKDPDIASTAFTFKLLVPMFLHYVVALIATPSMHSVAIREAYILRQSVKEIFSAFRVLQLLLPCRMVQALTPSFAYLTFLLKHADDPVSALHQALHAHVFETIVCIGLSGSLEKAEVDPRMTNRAFLSIIYHYLVYDKIMAYVIKHVDAWSDALGPIVRQDEQLCLFWSALERRIRFYGMLRSNLKEETIGWPSPSDILRCYCGDTVEDIRLRQCAGCQVVRYCSKRCQRDSWYSHHRLSCKFLKAAVGSSTPHHVKRSLHLLAALEDSQMQRRWDNIRKLVVAAQSEYPKDRERLVVELALDKDDESVRPLRHYLSLFNGLSENEVVDRLSSWPDPKDLRRSFCCVVITINDRCMSRQILFSPRTALDMETVPMLSRNC